MALTAAQIQALAGGLGSTSASSFGNQPGPTPIQAPGHPGATFNGQKIQPPGTQLDDNGNPIQPPVQFGADGGAYVDGSGNPIAAQPPVQFGADGTAAVDGNGNPIRGQFSPRFNAAGESGSAPAPNNNAAMAATFGGSVTKGQFSPTTPGSAAAAPGASTPAAPGGATPPGGLPGDTYAGHQEMVLAGNRDPRDYLYGRDPNYAANAGNAAIGLGNQQKDELDNLSLSEIGFAGNQGQQFAQQGNATVAGMSPYANNAASAGMNAQQGLAGIEATPGPSAAQAQLALGNQAAMAQQMALSRSGRGFGQSAGAQSVAANNMAGLAGTNSLQSAQLRAQEDAAQRARMASNLASGGQLAIQGNQAGGQLFAQGQAAQQQGLANQGSINMQAATQTAQNLAVGNQNQWQGQQMASNDAAQQMAADQAYEAMLTQNYGIKAGVQTAANAQNAQLIGAGIGAAGTLVGGVLAGPLGAAAGGVAGSAVGSQVSDIRAKTNIRPAAGVADQLAAAAPGYDYQYRDPAAVGAGPGQYTGPMAQSLESQPATRGTVTTGPDGMKRIDPGRLSLVTASAVSEQQRDIDRLMAELDTMKQQKGREIADATARPAAKTSAGDDRIFRELEDLQRRKTAEAAAY